MIILTGGAGFIGSCFLWKLNQEGASDVLVVDHLDDSGKKLNLEGKKFKDYLEKDEFLKLIQDDKLPKPEHVIHMGACSSTTLTDADYYRKNNYEYSKTLAQWAMKKGSPFIYASSAATYGDGEEGYSDRDEDTPRLKPLNLYGESKHKFDMWILENKLTGSVTGIKFFNVFGPNEYHKGEMRSVVCKAFPQVRDEGKIRLFKSYREDYADGEQKRDFIYVKDAIEVMWKFFTSPEVTGIFNLGTGEARSWNDLAKAMFSAIGAEPSIEYIDMPEELKSRYQYYTQAEMSKLSSSGCSHDFMPLEEAVADYTAYLKEESHL